MGFTTLNNKTNRKTIMFFDSKTTLIRICKTSSLYALIKLVCINDVGSYFVYYIYPAKNTSYTNPLKSKIISVGEDNASLKFYYDESYVYVLFDRYTYEARMYLSVENDNYNIIDSTKMSGTDVSAMTEF